MKNNKLVELAGAYLLKQYNNTISVCKVGAILFLTFNGSPLYSQISTDNLLAYYPLNGDVLDYGPSGYHGSQVGGVFVANADGIPSSALKLNGIDEYVNISSFANVFKNNLGEMTIYFLIKFDNDISDQSILSLGHSGEDLNTNVFEVEYENNQIQVETEIGASAINFELQIDQAANVVDFTWHEIFIRISGNFLEYCRDGELVYSDFYTPAETTTEQFFLGCFDGSGSSCCHVNGVIDELQFYTSLSQEVNETFSYSSCESEDFEIVVNNTVYNISNPNGVEVIQISCWRDSIVTVDLEFLPEYEMLIEETICESENYQITVNQNIYDINNPSGVEMMSTVDNCDSIITIDLEFLPDYEVFIEETFCESENYQIIVNQNLYNINNPTGVEVMSTVDNCDSIVTVDLEFLPDYEVFIEETFCESENYQIIVNQNLYNINNPTGVEVMSTVDNCDSIITVDLEFLPDYEVFIDETFCESENYQIIVNQNLYNINNPIGIEVMSSVDNCDSIITIDLEFLPSYEVFIDETFCESENYQIIVNQNLYDVNNPTGIEVMSSVDNCDSIITIDLEFLPSYEVFIDETFCESEDYQILVNQTLYDINNPTGVEVMSSVDNCDSIITVDLEFLPSYEIWIEDTFCESENYQIVVNQNVYDINNPVGVEVLTTMDNCDSIILIDLKFLPGFEVLVDETFCESEDYEIVINQTLYDINNPSGIEVITTESGCDSIITVDLEFVPSYEVWIKDSYCESENYQIVINQNVYDINNPVGVEVMTTLDNCDSIILIDLEFLPSFDVLVEDSYCESEDYQIIINQTLYDINNPSGIEVITTEDGCDSIITVDLEFQTEFETNISEVHCATDNYQLVVNQTIYDILNPTGIELITSSAGCDSTVIIDLEFLADFETIISEVHCESENYQLVVNQTIYDINNPTGQETLNSIDGCDSLVIIDLEFTDEVVKEFNLVICDESSYSIEVNGTTYDQDNPQGEEIFNLVDCDSIVLIQLEFAEASTFLISNSTCTGDGYSIVVNDVVYNEDNPQGVEILQNEVGCDSVVTVDLLFFESSSNAFEYNGCKNDGYAITVNNVTYDETNPNGEEVLQNSFGCDSVLSINLNFMLPDFDVFQYSGCSKDEYSISVNNVTYNEANPSGIEVFQSNSGCDSIVEIKLDFAEASMDSMIYFGCRGDGYTLMVNNAIYDEQNPKGTEVMENDLGCDSIVHVFLNFSDLGCNYYLPNIINTRSDFPNNLFQVITSEACEYTVVKFFIFDNWGSKIFSSNTDAAWDGTFNGKKVKQGVYVYHMVLDNSCGRVTKTGTITVLN